MVDDSINMANDVERYFSDNSDNNDVKTFIDAARGDMSAKSPFNYGHEGATVCDMMEFALNTKGGVTLATLFAYIGKASKDDDEAYAMLKAMADQFIWRAK
jgi:hypothetical protein